MESVGGEFSSFRKQLEKNQFRPGSFTQVHFSSKTLPQAVARSKDVQLSIPRSVADALALPEGRKKEKLQRELAVSLYREDMLSFGKARELAGMSKQEFGQLLGDRGVERHYGPEELAEDLRYAKGEVSFHDKEAAE